MGSGIRVILRNERYRGVVCWNASEWVKDPDTGRRKRLMRPREDWIAYVDESLRIISDDLWERAWRRVRPANTDSRLKAGGKPQVSAVGSAPMRSCGNSVLVRRDCIEDILLGPIRDDLLKPDRVARMAREMQDYFSERMRTMQTRAVELPASWKTLSPASHGCANA